MKAQMEKKDTEIRYLMKRLLDNNIDVQGSRRDIGDASKLSLLKDSIQYKR